MTVEPVKGDGIPISSSTLKESQSKTVLPTPKFSPPEQQKIEASRVTKINEKYGVIPESIVKEMSTKNIDQQIKLLDEKIIKLSATPKEAERYQIEKATLLLQRKNKDDFDDAVCILVQIINQDPSPVVQHMLVQAYLDNGHVDWAYEAYESAIAQSMKGRAEALKELPNNGEPFESIFGPISTKLSKCTEGMSEAVQGVYKEAILKYFQNPETIQILKDLRSNNQETEYDVAVKLLNACDALVQAHPTWLPRFLSIVVEDPKLILNLNQLSAQFKSHQQAFDHLIEHYVMHEKDGKTVDSVITSQFVEKILKDPDQGTKFIKLMDIERERGISLLPIMLKQEWMWGAFFILIQSNDHFSRNLHIIDGWGEEHFNVLQMRIAQKASLVIALFELGSNEFLSRILFDPGFWSSDTDPIENTKRLYETIVNLRFNPDKKHYGRLLLNLFNYEANHTLIDKLIDLPDNSYREKLMDILILGDVQFVEKVLNKPFDNVLAAQMSAANLPILRALMRLGSNHPLMQMAIAASKKNSHFLEDKTFHALMKMHAQGEKLQEELSEKEKKELGQKQSLLDVAFFAFQKRLGLKPGGETKEETKILNWIKKGHSVLAKDYMNSGFDKDEFWQKASNLKNVNTIQHLRDFHLSLQSMKRPPNSWTKAETDFFNNTALKCAESMSEDQFGNFIGALQVLLKTNPEILRTKNTETTWKEQDPLKIWNDLQIDMRHIIVPDVLDICNKADLSKSSDLNELAIALLTKAGTINRYVIDLFLLSPNVNADTPHARYFKTVLMQLKEDVTYRDRFESVVPPKEGTPEWELLQAMIEGDLTDPQPEEQVRKARVGARLMILVALLQPLRQSNVGSCPGTSVAIQTESTPEGRHVILEDYLSIMAKGSISRTNENGVKVSYQINFSTDAFANKFPDDNELKRVREFIITSMDSPARPKCEDTRKKFRELFLKKTKSLKAGMQEDARKKIDFDKMEKVALEMGQSVIPRYFPYLKTLNAEGLGVYLFVDPQTQEPLIKSMAILEGYLMRTLEEAIVKHGLEKETADILRDEMRKYIQSGFLLDFGLDVETDPFRPDLDNLNVSPLVEESGGYIKEIVRRYHLGNSHGTVMLNSFPKNANQLTRLFDFVDKLPPQAKEKAQKNPQQLMLLTSNNHDFNLRIGEIIKVLGNKPNAVQELIKETEDANARLLNTKLNPKNPNIQNEMIEKVVKLNPDLPELKDVLVKIIQKRSPKTIEELCDCAVQAIVWSKAELTAQEEACAVVLKALTELRSVKNLVPRNRFEFCDTNWDQTEYVSFGIGIKRGRLEPFFSSRTGEVITLGKQQPWNLSNVRVLSFGNQMDEFSRGYHRVE